MNIAHNKQATIIPDRLENIFHLTESEIYLCDRYYILHWSGGYLIDKVQEWESPRSDDATLSNQGIIYKVKTVGEFNWFDLISNPTDQYRISFRRAVGDTFGYALITKITLGNKK